MQIVHAVIGALDAAVHEATKEYQRLATAGAISAFLVEASQSLLDHDVQAIGGFAIGVAVPIAAAFLRGLVSAIEDDATAPASS